MNFPHYKQLESRDCGPTSLKIIAKYFGKNISLQYLRDLCSTNREGVSFVSLSHAAETIGLRSLALEVNFEQLCDKVPLPCISHWNQNHFVVIYKTDKNNIYVSDPAKNLIKYSYKEFKSHWGAGSKGLVMAIEPQPFFKDLQENEVKEKYTAFQTIFKYIKPYHKSLIQLLIVMFLITILQAIVPFIFRAIIDVGVGRKDLTFINVILIANVILIISIALGNFVKDWIIKHVSARFSIAIISDYIIKLMRMPVQYFESKTSGDLFQRVSDHERIKNFLMHNSLNTIFSAITFIVFGIILLLFNSLIFFIFIGGSILYIAWVTFFNKFQEKLDWQYYDLNSQNNSFWIETLASMVDIKINNYDKKKRWKWESIQARLYHLNIRSLSIINTQEMGSQLINGLKNIFLTFYSAKAVLAGEMTLGMMISTQFILGFLNTPISQFIAFLHAFNSAKISFLRLSEIHNNNDEETFQRANNFSFPDDKSITLKSLYFQYNTHTPYILKNISLHIPQNKITAIVGESGSGKTTLLKLLLKLYQPTSGEMLLGNLNISNIHLRNWRSECAAVLQEGRIFNDTLINNIVLDDDQIDYHKLRTSVDTANLTDLIESLPLGFNSKIGEKGIGLSQGQKQRILIARALYKDPCYLFLDEATNALDSINESQILLKFDEAFKNRTVLIAAHRLSTIIKADKIIVLDKGMIVETGTHEELIALKKYYHRLVSNQLIYKTESPLITINNAN